MNVCPLTPRAAHGMCALDKYIAVFGGRDSEGRTNDLHIFDTGYPLGFHMYPVARQSSVIPRINSFYSVFFLGNFIFA